MSLLQQAKKVFSKVSLRSHVDLTIPDTGAVVMHQSCLLCWATQMRLHATYEGRVARTCRIALSALRVHFRSKCSYIICLSTRHDEEPQILKDL